MSRLSTDARTECEDRARILKQNSQKCFKSNEHCDEALYGVWSVFKSKQVLVAHIKEVFTVYQLWCSSYEATM